MLSEEETELVNALRGAGLNIPDECETLGHITIAVKANGPAEESFDLDGPNAPPGPNNPLSLSMSGGRRRRLHRGQSNGISAVIAKQEELARHHSVPPPAG